MGCCRRKVEEKEEEVEEQPEGDRAICGTLCMCQAVAVLSTVSIIYLSVIIYLPAKRELESGIGETPVMCTTIESRTIENDIELCKQPSCGEWCLSKTSSCRQLYVSVRQNGSDVEWEGCTDLVETVCPRLNRSEENSRNCARDHHCTSLDRTWLCEKGFCWNITEAFTCSWDQDSVGPLLDCAHKRNCVELDGMYQCDEGRCRRLNSWYCERACSGIPTASQNMVVMAGDQVVSAHCRRGSNSRTGERVWEDSGHPDSTLLASCTSLSISPDGELMRGADCINGTTLPSTLLPETTNFTHLLAVFYAEGPRHKLDLPDMKTGLPRGTHIPFDTDIKIFNRSKLHINHQGCVNTLQYECQEFYRLHGQDSRNQSSPSRFPCYYSPDNTHFVVRRYDLRETKTWFLLFFSIPSALFVVSCLMLFLCSHLVGVRPHGAMAIMPSCCPQGLGGQGTELDMTALQETSGAGLEEEED